MGFRSVVGLETPDELHRRAVEGIDVLIVVAHREQGEPACIVFQRPAGESRNQLVLLQTDILILVHEDPPEAREQTLAALVRFFRRQLLAAEQRNRAAHDVPERLVIRMGNAARLFSCASCRRQVVLCRRCDHGNIYCSRSCSDRARRRSMRLAGQRYQNSRRGRHKHAERQRRYRERRRHPMAEDSGLREESDASPFDRRAVASCCDAHVGGTIRNPALRPRSPRQGTPLRPLRPVLHPHGLSGPASGTKGVRWSSTSRTRAGIPRLFLAEKWRVGKIARRLRVHHDTVDRIVAEARDASAPEPPRCGLSPFRDGASGKIAPEATRSHPPIRPRLRHAGHPVLLR